MQSSMHIGEASATLPFIQPIYRGIQYTVPSKKVKAQISQALKYRGVSYQVQDCDRTSSHQTITGVYRGCTHPIYVLH